MNSFNKFLFHVHELILLQLSIFEKYLQSTKHVSNTTIRAKELQEKPNVYELQQQQKKNYNFWH